MPTVSLETCVRSLTLFDTIDSTNNTADHLAAWPWTSGEELFQK